MVDIFKEIQSIVEKGEAGVVASVVARKGSAPMSADAKMIVYQDGSMKGTVGGGCLEADVWAEAKRVLGRGGATKMSFNLTEAEAGESGHICGGIVDVLVEPLSNYSAQILSEIVRIRSEGGRAVLASVVSRSDGKPPGPGDRMLIYRDGSKLGSIEGVEPEVLREAAEVLHEERPANRAFRVPGADVQVEVFLEPVLTRPTVYIFGGGHVSKHIAKVADVAGFRIVVVEDREQYANRQRFPEAEGFIVVEDFERLAEAVPEIDETDMAIIVTRGHQYDEDILAWAWTKPFRYLGMIGSRTKILATYRHLEEKMGVPREAFIQRVRAPMGLEIGADVPGEIAVAIVAELIQSRRQGLIRDPELAGKPKSAALMKLVKSQDKGQEVSVV
ncbi:MAG: XdhC family protein [Candidatus Tectomicrobia bacterium]|nr:XdhC family protein [Candidatus Tectomicrobia bacterium]